MFQTSSSFSINDLHIVNPRLEIDLAKIRRNARAVYELCLGRGVDVVGVTKGCAGSPEIAHAMVSGGIRFLGDSRLQNIQRLRNAGFDLPILLIRSPMPSEIDRVVELVSTSVNSDLSVLRLLADAATKRGENHQIILMVELGDEREGLQPGEVIPLLKSIKHLDGLAISGIGTNIGCHIRMYPTANHIQALVSIRDRIQSELDIEIKTISAGNSAVLHLIESGDWPSGANQVRVGEAILLGLDGIEGRPILGTRNDAFRLVAEVIEVKSVRRWRGYGTSGDQGVVAILAVGYQDIGKSKPVPLQSGLIPGEATSDHLVVQVQSPSLQVNVGQEVAFALSYSGLLAAFTSRYVQKVFLGENHNVD